MHETIEKLTNGDRSVVDYFKTAKEKWGELFQRKKESPVKEWSEWLTNEQITFFEQRCGGRSEGQEVMAWSGFGSLYTTKNGFDENVHLAKKLVKAFAGSTCSIEVKGQARRAALSYGLDDDPEIGDLLKKPW